MVLPYVFDTEVYPNCFVGVFDNIKTGERKTFSFWEHIDDRQALVEFLTQPGLILIGYNNINFDGVILQAIVNDPNISHEELLELRDSAIASRWPLIHPSERVFREIDLFRIWHYDNKNRYTSLKHLEFFYRFKSIQDLPYDHNSKISSISAFNKVVKYCGHDVDATKRHFQSTGVALRCRRDLKKQLGLDMINAPDSTIGQEIIMDSVHEYMGERTFTQRDIIRIKDIIKPIFRSREGICKQIIHSHFDKIVMHGEPHPQSKKNVFNFKGNLYEFNWAGIEVVVGLGGIHGCIGKGVFESDDDWIIKSSDVTSHYPNAVINFNIYPDHIGPMFVKAFKEKVYDKRASYPKATHYGLNKTYKLACNAAVGKFKDHYSPLYDPKCNAEVTINNQLSILSLADDLVKAIPGAQLLLLNTDGLEIRIPRKFESVWEETCKQWEDLTKFSLEHVDYQKLAIHSVNHYIAIDTAGKVKRKGIFCTYEDLVNTEEFHRDPSAKIIPLALSEYFEKGIPIEDTVNGCDNIHEFIFGVKKTKAFRYVVLIPNSDRSISIKKFTERVFRYYISNSPKSGNLFKFWNDGRVNAVNKGDLIMPCMTLRTEKASKFLDLDREYYIQQAHKIRSEIEYA